MRWWLVYAGACATYLLAYGSVVGAVGLTNSRFLGTRTLVVLSFGSDFAGGGFVVAIGGIGDLGGSGTRGTLGSDTGIGNGGSGTRDTLGSDTGIGNDLGGGCIGCTVVVDVGGTLGSLAVLSVGGGVTARFNICASWM